MKKILMWFLSFVACACVAQMGSYLIGNGQRVQTLLVSTGAVRLQSVLGVNDFTNTVYVQIFEQASTPTNGSSPKFWFPANQTMPYSVDFPNNGIVLTSAVVAISTTATNLTLAGTNATIYAILGR